jgi:hypothetical protein
MSDPWWNIRCYLPRSEVRKLFSAWAAMSAAKLALELKARKELTPPAKNGTLGGSMLNPSPPAGD